MTDTLSAEDFRRWTEELIARDRQSALNGARAAGGILFYASMAMIDRAKVAGEDVSQFRPLPTIPMAPPRRVIAKVGKGAQWKREQRRR